MADSSQPKSKKSNLLGSPLAPNPQKQKALQHVGASLLTSGYEGCETFVDLFGGNGAFTLYMAQAYPDKHIVYNDINPELAQLFKILKSESESADLVAWLASQSYSEEDFKTRSEVYNAAQAHDIRERLYLSRMGFRGLTKVPNMTKDKDGIVSLKVRDNYDNFTKYSDVLKNVSVSTDDAFDLIKLHKDDPSVLIYCDPPDDEHAKELLKQLITNPEYKCKIVLHLEHTEDLYHRLKDNVRLKYPKKSGAQKATASPYAPGQYMLVITN